MRLITRASLLLVLLLSAGAGVSQKAGSPQPTKTDDSLLQKFFTDFNLPASAAGADVRLHRTPKDVVALFVRMETAAELQERPEVVLDAALRLCAIPAPPQLHELASNRVLQHAANSWTFNLSFAG